MTTPEVQEPRRPADFPTWVPPWAHQVADLFFSGTTAAFVLHGNTYDLFRMDARAERYGVLAEFLAEQLFGRWSLVLHYDLGRGLRAFAGRDEARLKDMVALANRRVGDLARCRESRRPPSRSSIASCAPTSWPRRKTA